MVRPGCKSLWLSLLLLATHAAAQSTPSAADPGPTIQFAEPVALPLTGSDLHFDAYGRRFSITLADNDRVLSQLSAAHKAQLSTTRLLRGAVDGAPGSWVRLAESSTGVEGAIWDGQELYAVTTYARIASKLATSLDVAGGQTVVYRLSDMRDALPRDFCAASVGGTSAAAKMSAGATALDDYRALMQEISEITAPLTRQIEISLIGDAALQSAESDATAAMLARLNIVEGIFSAQLGLLVLATDVRLMPLGADPLTSSKGVTLLEQLAAYRSSHLDVRARGLAHLITGKDLENNTAGIAYIGTVCDAQYAVSVSEHGFGTTISALIMAHELGHNFGATHDGEPGTSCVGVSGSFIMTPAVSGSATFSQCSVGTMTQKLSAASCVSPAEYADITLETSVGNVTGEGGQAFTLPFLVRSGGNRTAEDVTATVTLPAMIGFAIESAAASTGSCAVDGLAATCTLGTVGPGEAHSLSITARGASAANFTAQARVSASNDRVTSNNSRTLSVALRSGVDAAVALSASTLDVPVGASVELYADVRSLRSMPLRNATLSFTLSQPVASATLPGSVCSVSAFAVSCAIAELPAGGTRRLTVTATTVAGGPMYAGAGIAMAGDGDFTNNHAALSAWVRPAHDLELTASPGSDSLAVGAPFEIAFTLRSRGSGATEVVELTVSVPAAIVVDSIDAGGGACAPSEFTTVRCTFAALAPDETRVVRLRVHGTRAATSDLIATAVTANDGYAANDSTVVHLRVDHAVDLAVLLASGGSGIESTRLEGQVTLRSNGREATQSATLDIVLHAAGALRAARIHGGADCTLLAPQRARCALPALARNALLYVDYEAEFPEAGTFDVTFVAAAPGDTAPQNDSLTRAVLVRPYTDIALSGSLQLADRALRRAALSTRAARRRRPRDRRRMPHRRDRRRHLRFHRPARALQRDGDGDLSRGGGPARLRDRRVGVHVGRRRGAQRRRARPRRDACHDGPEAARRRERRRAEEFHADLSRDRARERHREGAGRAPRGDAARGGVAGRNLGLERDLQRLHRAAL
jgi:hypothetical protein